MINVAAAKVGDKVHYKPIHFGPTEHENGVIKEIRSGVTDAVWVVYHCGDEWWRYQEYTSAKTLVSELYPGWQ